MGTRRKKIRLGSAEERREAVLGAAIIEFAARGLNGASTERVAENAGISHSYVFKLFGTKKELFAAATGRIYENIRSLFREAAEAHPDNVVWAMGNAYRELLARREELLMLLHGFAASEDPEIGKVVRERYADLYRYARELAGADDERMRPFWSQGMLMTVAAAIDLPSLSGKEEWVDQLLNPPG